MNLVVTIAAPSGSGFDTEVQKITDPALVRRIMATIIVYEDEQTKKVDVVGEAPDIEDLTERAMLDFVRNNPERINTLLRADDKFGGDAQR